MRPASPKITWVTITWLGVLVSGWTAVLLAQDLPDQDLPIELVAPAEAWATDPRISAKTQLELDGSRLRLTAEFPGDGGSGAAVVLGGAHHWADASALLVELDLPAEADQMVAKAFVRIGRNNLFESPLSPLESGRNRWHLPLDSRWTSVSDRNRRLRPYDLLTVRELGLQFFLARETPTQISFTLTSPCLERRQTPPDEALEILALRRQNIVVPQHRVHELAFDLNRTFRNPYDPRQIAVDLEIIDPDGKILRHPAFFFEPWQLVMMNEDEDVREQAVQRGNPGWRARFSPWKPGRHHWTLIARIPTTGTEPGGALARRQGFFDVAESDHPGYVRVASNDPRYLELSSGEPYYPIGHNLRSPGDFRPRAYSGAAAANALDAERMGTRAYEQWLGKMSAAGETFARMWLVPWWCGLEWNVDEGFDGLGYYHQANAARVDRVLEAAEAQGVRLAIETFHHGAVSTHLDADWSRNPHASTQDGGYLEFATDFFTDPRARASHQRYLRYVIARWGASPSVAWWGLLTEAEWAEPYFRSLPIAEAMLRQAARSSERSGANAPNARPQPRPEPYLTEAHRDVVAAWLGEMAATIRRLNAHPRLVTSQFAIPAFGLEVWSKGDLDIVQNNAYTHLAKRWQPRRFAGTQRSVVDMMRVFADTYTGLFEQPILIAEWGGHPVRNRPGQLPAELHAGTWASFMTGLAGSTGFWWWNLLDAEDAYGTFYAVSAFGRGEDRRGHHWRSELAELSFPENLGPENLGSDDVGPNDVGPDSRAGLVLHDGQRLFAWIYHRALVDPATAQPAQGFNDPAYPPSGQGELHLPPELPEGQYRVETWDPHTGHVLNVVDLTIGPSSEPRRAVPLFPHRADIALKIKRILP